jgi:hypothetical protein
MKRHIQAQGFEIWQSIVDGYIVPIVPPTNDKATKLQYYRGHFEQIRMKEDENIATYFLQVNEIVNAIMGLGEEIQESIIVQKVLI